MTVDTRPANFGKLLAIAQASVVPEFCDVLQQPDSYRVGHLFSPTATNQVAFCSATTSWYETRASLDGRSQLLVHQFLERSAARSPNKVALVCGPERLTYAHIDAAANRLAAALRHEGVQRGDRVAVFLPNGVEAVISIFAILKAGGVFVVLSHGAKADKLASIINNCRAVALIADGAKLSAVNAVISQVGSLRVVVLTRFGDGSPESSEARYRAFDKLQCEYPPDSPSPACIDVDLACLIYTSGSTGEPKGVMSDHSNVVFAVKSITSYLRNVQDDIVLSVLPLSFDYGLYQVLMTFYFGGTLVLERSFTYPATVLELIQQERVTGFPGVPTIFAMLLPMDVSPYDLSSLRYISSTAAVLAPNHVQELRRKFAGATVYSMYGLTETKRTLYLPPEQLDLRPGSVGIAIPGTEAWIEDEAGNRLGPGQVGELVVRGRHVMRGYWEAPEATAARFRPGPIPGERVCHTGDLFAMDSDAYFYFVARKDDVIKSRGEKVAPVEVEKVIYALPGVVHAAVVGVADPILGQAVKAFIVPNGIPLTREMVIAHCKAHLEDYMVPKYIEFRKDLPTTSSGKIKKAGLV